MIDNENPDEPIETPKARPLSVTLQRRKLSDLPAGEHGGIDGVVHETTIVLSLVDPRQNASGQSRLELPRPKPENH